MLPTQLVENTLWWTGSHWLMQQLNLLQFIIPDMPETQSKELKNKNTLLSL